MGTWDMIRNAGMPPMMPQQPQPPQPTQGVPNLSLGPDNTLKHYLGGEELAANKTPDYSSGIDDMASAYGFGAKPKWQQYLSAALGPIAGGISGGIANKDLPGGASRGVALGAEQGYAQSQQALSEDENKNLAFRHQLLSDPRLAQAYHRAKSMTGHEPTTTDLSAALADIDQESTLHKDLGSSLLGLMANPTLAQYVNPMMQKYISTQQQIHPADTHTYIEEEKPTITGVPGAVASKFNMNPTQKTGRSVSTHKTPAGAGGGGGKAKTNAVPAGATGKAPGSDGRMYYHDAKGNALGPV